MPLARQVVEAVAVENGVCIRPLAMRRVDTATGETSVHAVPCGATLASKCPPCAERARKLRMAQCKSAGTSTPEPLPDPDPPWGFPGIRRASRHRGRRGRPDP